MKAAYEHVDFGAGCSVRIYHRRLPRIPFEWHHHPEYELTLTMNSRGRRYIGDSVASYGADDLVLVPPNLPHTWASNRSIEAGAPQVAIVIWFDGAWIHRLADVCPEHNGLRDLLRRAACGLRFEDGAGTRMRERLDALLADAPRERLTAVLEVLHALATTPAEPLATPSAFGAATGTLGGHEPERLARVLALIDTQYARPLQLAALAKAAGLSERTLTRQFARHLGESVGRYVTRVRLGHACRLLADTTLPVSVIAERSGFPSAAHFNRQFKAARGTTPVAWRRQFAQARNAGAAQPAARDAALAASSAPSSITSPAASPALTERSPSLRDRRPTKAARPR
ncbi:AraC family transcriptional regulator [Burkholderia plantarii]|uniref:AraC family transcriptional regulator n=1 Tax=Burkholderia plantarii TaxID=41899 RepID=UPI0027296244|nr:AraC family transcriptional regulator [Burkholderia plantarii]WLE62048.1 AraC family transcriptional regulator [Burkholderia plantarii]